MNILDLKRKALGWFAMAENAGSDGGMSGSGGGGSGSDNGSRGSVGSSTSNYGSRQGFAGATSYGGGTNGTDGGSVGDGSDSGWAAKTAKQEAASQAAQDQASDDAKRAALEAKANELADKNPQLDRVSALIGAANNFGMDTDPRDVSPGGWTYGQVSTLSKAGFGDVVGVNAKNPSQNVAGVLGSRTMNDTVMPAVAGLVTAAVPGAGLMMSGMRAVGSVTSGEKSASDAAKDFAIDFASSKVAGMINSKVSDLVGAENMQSLGRLSSVSKAFGGPGMPNIGASVVSGALNVAGINKSTGSGFTSQNDPAADNGFTAPGTNYGGDNSSPTTPSATTPTTPTAKEVSGLDTNLNMNLWRSIDGSGWRSPKAT
jgi:hypothetical protein